MFKRQILLINLSLFVLNVSTFSQEVLTKDSLLNQLNKYPLDDTSRYKILDELAYSCSNSDTSIFYAKKLIQESQNKNKYWESKGYLQLGNALSQKGNYNNAIEAHFKSAEIAEKNNNYIGQAHAYAALAGVYTISKNYQSAQQYYNKAIEIGKDKFDPTTLANISLNKGSLFLLLKQYDSSLNLFIKAQNIYSLENNSKGIAYSLGLIARVKAEEGKFSQAKVNLQEAIRLLKQLGDYYALISFNLRLAKIEQNQHDFVNAIFHASESYNISLRENLLPQLRDACNTLSSIYNDINDFENAYKYQSLYYTYRDSIINEESIRKMADLRTEYEVSQKQAEIDILLKEKNIQKIIGISLSVVLLLTAGLIFVLSRNSKRNRILSEQLAEQKAELQIQRDQLEELNKTKDRFFSIISHDLRGPIGVLNGTTILIREYLESKDYQQLADLTTNMEYSVKKVQHLLDNLLEWAVSQQGKFNYQPEKVELNEVVHEAMGIFEGMAFAKNIMFTYVCKFDNFYIIADRNSLLTILRNLISNAIKFTERNGAITIMAYKSDKEVILKVSDTGVGMPEEKLNTLFIIDENKSTWGTEREKGLGIGLSLVYDFVQMCHGTIEVESKEGVGTTFIVKLPTEITLNRTFHPLDI